MASIKSAISYGPIYIPINLQKATQDTDIHFNQLHKEDHSRVKQKKSCGHCGKELSTSDIVRGYQYQPDKYVVVTDDELESIKTEKNRSIVVDRFTTLDSISPTYFDQTYHALPQAGAEAAFETIRLALLSEQAIGIGKVVLGSNETLMALIPRQDGMLCQTMFFEEEVRALPNYNKPQIDDAQVNMARTIVASNVKPFAPSVCYYLIGGMPPTIAQVTIEGVIG